VMERQYWDDYMDAYEKMIRNTATKYAPWIVVPADNKWFSRLLVMASINDLLDRLDLRYPKLGRYEMKEMRRARKILESG
jgi:polyphosphate kinase 2 (PPK2 family)